MALPSGVTLASLTVVAASGIGLVAAQVAGADEAPASAGSAGATTATQTTTPPQPSRTAEPTREEPSSRPAPPKPTTLIEVYNNSGLSGLADETASKLERRGWRVAATDNWYGNIPSNTVYHPRGQRAEGKQLARDLGYDRVRLTVSPMSANRLTVIVVNG